MLSDFGYDIIGRIASTRFLYESESDLQAGIAEVLADLHPEREVRLGSRADRIDLVVNSDHYHIGIECKTAGSSQSLQRQLIRYAKTGKITELIVVTNRAAHKRDLAGWSLTGKEHPIPVEVVKIRWV